MSDEDLFAINQIYGTDNNEIKYMEFINDGNPFKTYQQQIDEIN
jgi:hypothetical protein